MDVNLPAVPIQGRGQTVQHRLGVDRFTGVALPVEVGLEQCRGARLDHAVLEELRRGWPNPRRGVLCPPLAQSPDHAFDSRRVRLRVGRHDHSKGEPSGAVRGRIGPKQALGRQRLHDRGDAPLGRQWKGALEARRQLGIGSLREQPRHQIHRRLPQRAAGLAGARIPLDAAVGRVGCIARDPRELQRPAVGPGGVPIGRFHERRPVGRDPVERRLRRIGARKGCELPADAAEPPVGPSGRAGRDRIQDGGRVLEGVQGALTELDTAEQEVNVAVLEPRKQHPAGEVHHFGLGADQAGRQTVAAHVNDSSLADRDRPRPAPRRVHRIHCAVPKHEIRRRSVRSRLVAAQSHDDNGRRSDASRAEADQAHRVASESGLTGRRSRS